MISEPNQETNPDQHNHRAKIKPELPKLDQKPFIVHEKKNHKLRNLVSVIFSSNNIIFTKSATKSPAQIN